MKKKYLTIGAWVGTIISIANLFRHWDEYLEVVNDCDETWWISSLIGIVAAGMVNILLWPVSLAFTLYKYIRGE